MSDVDPRLGKELDRLYDNVARTEIPDGLKRFDPRAPSRRRWFLTKAARSGGGLVLLAAVAGVVAVGLSNHHPTSAVLPRPAGESSPTPGPSPSNSSSPTPSPASAPSASPTPDPTQGWRPVSDPAGQFSFRVPAGWQVHGPCVNTGQQQHPADEVRVGPADLPPVAGGANSGGGPGTSVFPPGESDCGTDFWNGIVADSYAGTQLPLEAGSSGCLPPTTEAVTVDGVAGTRRVLDEHCPPYSSDVEYYFAVAALHRTFEITFQRNPGDPDLTAELDLLMTHTWAFHA